MDSDKKPDEKTTTDSAEPSVDTSQAPADALSRTPDELDADKAAQAAADTDLSGLDTELPAKKVSAFKRLYRKINIYFLIFVIIVVVAGAIAIVMYFNSQKPPVDPTLQSQSLTTEELKQLANTDASVGSTAQTLTIQGSAVINGQTLARGNLNVAGNIQSGGSLQAPSLTVSGATNLNDTQINGLQVAGNTAIQGSTTIRDLNVSGATSLSGPVTASQITVTRLVLSGNASLEVPNHISFTGATPSRTTNGGVLGNGGSANVGGSDTAGTINVNSGNNPTPGCFMTVRFNQAFSKQPHVVVSPVGAAAGQLQYYVERNTTTFSLCSANAPAANQAFAFDYFVTY